MEKKIIECVPNFSEGRNLEIIKNITDAIESVEGVSLLDVDPGEATNRTVVTFAGEPETVAEAAFRGIRKAAELIDMSHHHGAHPRMGATDVCPFVPVSGVTLEECAALARKLGERVANELEIPVYAYEAAAFTPARKNLAVCRKGEYEGLAARMGLGDGADFGDRPFDDKMARTGATAIGARDFLIAVNFNLNTTSTRRANAIAFDVREKGRPLREGGKLTGKPLKDADGKPLMQPGTLKGTKAIGWYIDEYGIAQVSMNITDTAATPLHIAFDEVAHKADARGIRVTGTEIVGLVPRKALVDAGEYFLRKQQRSLGIPDSEKIRIAIKSMGLDELKPFVVEEKVVEDVLAARQPHAKQLVDLTAKAFAETTASESPAPGGGSVAAYMGALGAALATMVANLAAHKAGWDDRWEEFSDMAVRGQRHMDTLLTLVDRRLQRNHGRIRYAQGHRGRKGCPQPGHTRCHRPCRRGAIRHPARSLRHLRRAARRGQQRQPGLGQRRRRGCPCCPCRSTRCIPQHENQRRRPQGRQRGRHNGRSCANGSEGRRCRERNLSHSKR